MTKRSKEPGKSGRGGREIFRSRSRRKSIHGRRLAVELLENRLLLTGDLLYQATEPVALTLRLSEGTVQIVDTSQPATVLASKPLNEITAGVRIEGNTFDVSLTIDASMPPVIGGIVFAGGTGNSTLTGPDADTDWIVSGLGSGLFGVTMFNGVESLVGGAGADTFLVKGSFGGSIDGGGGTNTLDYSTHATGVTVNLADGAAVGTAGCRNIQNMVGSPFADTLTGDASANLIDGGGGDDMLIGGAGDDIYVLQPGAGMVTIIEVEDGGSDTLVYSAFSTSVNVNLAAGTATGVTTGFSHIENVVGGSGNDTLTGNSQANRLVGGPGNDTLTGGAGDDTYVLDPSGTDTIIEDVDAGSDTLDYSAFTASVTVDLSTGVATGTTPSSNISNLENIVGGSGNDTLIGNSRANRLVGGPGDDTLTGGVGDDTYVLDPSGTDTIVEGVGAGSDTLDYSAFTESVTVDLSTGVATGTTFSSNIANIENVVGGSGNDTLTGNSRANRLVGGPGDDTLAGGSGDDIYVLTIGGGADTITEYAGEGSDTIFGPDVDTDWIITGTGSGTITGGTTFAGIEYLVGGSADDNFAFTAEGSISGSVEGGGQTWSDAVIGPNADRTWSITGNNAGTLQTHGSFTGIENLQGGYGADTFSLAAGGSISGEINGGPDNASAPDNNGEQTITRAVDVLDYSGRSSAVSVDLADATGTDVGSFTAIDKIVGSSAGDILSGPDAAVVLWTVDGANAGEVAGIRFESFENLTGASDGTSDAFTFEQNGSLSGTLSGGTDTLDAIRVYKEAGKYTVFNPGAGTDKSGTLTLHGKTIAYAGIDHAELFEQKYVESNLFEVKVRGTAYADTIIISDDATAGDGKMQVQFVGLVMFDGTSFTTDPIYSFTVPTDFLLVEGKHGADSIEVKSLDSAFSAALKVYGIEEGAPEFMPGSAKDEVRFSGNVYTHGGMLQTFADRIYVDAGVEISTLRDPLDPTSEGGDIDFRARRVNTTEFVNASPVMVSLRDVVVDIGAGAKLQAGAVYIFCQAEDRDLTTLLGTSAEVNNFIIKPLLEKVSDLAMMPVKVLYKQSEATITIHEGAQLIASGPVGLYATAAADASGTAKSKLFSVAYGQAKSTATIDIQAGALLKSTDGSVVVTSDAKSTAGVKTETAQKAGDSGIAGSLAVGYSIANSTITLAGPRLDANGNVLVGPATVDAARTANLRANGENKTETESKGSTFADGAVGFGFSISISKSNIHTQVDGTVIARAQDGYAVKLEINPLETDPNKPGYIDYDKNMINVGPTALVSEDTVHYSSRRGMRIGGLLDDTDYIVISVADDPNTTDVDESNYIKLALTEQNAIDGEAVDLLREGEYFPYPYDYIPVPPVTMNTKAFDGSQVDSQRSRITLDNKAFHKNDNQVDFSLLGQTFELGQAVVYRQGTAPITGLVDGQTYYIITGINQFDLQGDSKFVEKQVVQLAETENEARAGVHIAFELTDANAEGFRLEAKHVLDSGWATGIGILSGLKAEDKASAEAGVADDEDDEKKDGDEKKGEFSLAPEEGYFNAIVGKLAEPVTKAIASGVKALPVNVAGSFAFSYGDHQVSTDVGGSAVLKSNEDLEVQATIDHQVQLSAESSIEPPEKKEGSDDNSGGSGGIGISIAADVGIFKADAQTTVHSGAQLDALRATRLISLVKHPYLKSPDEIFPSTLGEFLTAVQREGPEAVKKYLKETLDLKGRMNSFAGASAESDKVSIAGMVNVLTFNDVAKTLVESGVLINQDQDWRDYATNPHENNLDPATGDSDQTAHEQVVSIEASNYMQLVNMAGYFDLEFTPEDLKKKENPVSI